MTHLLARPFSRILPHRTGFVAALACVSFACLVATSQADAAPFVLAYTDGQTGQSYTNLQAYHAQLSAVGLGSAYNLTAAGAVGTEGMTNTTRSIISFAKGKGLPLYPTVSDYSNDAGGFDPAISKAVLASAASRSKAVTNLVNLATANGFAGIDIDLEAVQPSDKANYSAFISALATGLHAQGLKLVISIPPKTGDKAPDYLGGYDYAAIGAAVDYFQVMTYDEVGPGWASSGFNGEVWPGPESGLDWQKAILSYTVSRVPASKVLAGLPSYGYDYSTGQVVHWSSFPAVLASHAGAVLQRDAASATPYATWGTVRKQPDGTAWSNSTKQPALWYDDAQSIQAKTALVNAYGLAGTSVWAMGYEDASFWSAMKAGLDNGATAPLSIDAAAGAGGSIVPSGAVQVLQGRSQGFSIVPNAGYDISAVTVDGASIGAVTSYTFSDVQAGHSIRAAFTARGGSGDTQIEASGTGQVWTKNTTALSNANRQARTGINDGKLATGVTLNAAGEGEAGKWEAAGVTWAAAKTVSKVAFINGAVDSYGNGYFESGVSLQYTTDGTRWIESGWAIGSAYPNSAAAGGASYAFGGTPLAGVVGVRVSGKTGAQSWSAIVNEVQVTGR
jgi:spore germination protein YaaH